MILIRYFYQHFWYKSIHVHTIPTNVHTKSVFACTRQDIITCDYVFIFMWLTLSLNSSHVYTELT